MLTLCAMSLRQTDLLGKVAAAAAAGFPAIGVTVADYLDARRQGFGDRELRTRIDAAGVVVAEIESPWDWTAPDQPAQRQTEDAVFQAVDALGCEQVNVVQFEDHPLDVVRTGLDRIAVRAARSDARIALEFMPFSQLLTLADAWRVIEGCTGPIDLVLDVWHLARSGGRVADIPAAAAQAISSIQLSGVAADVLDDVKHEARHHRLLPDEGTLDVADVLAELSRRGVEARLSVEVWSDSLLALEPDVAARRVYDATQRVLPAAVV